jgi:hypothetical protein
MYIEARALVPEITANGVVLEPRVGIFRSVQGACRAFAFAASRFLRRRKNKDIMDA